MREDVSADRVTKLPRVTLFATVIYLSDLPYSKWNYLEILIKLQGYLKVVTIFKDLRGIGRYQMNLFCVPLGQQIHDAHGEVSSKECLPKIDLITDKSAEPGEQFVRDEAQRKNISKTSKICG